MNITITYVFDESTMRSKFIYSNFDGVKEVKFLIDRKTAKQEVKMHGLKVVSKTFLNGVLTVNYGL